MARILGIDIDEHTIRAALVRTGLRKLELERFLEVEIPEVVEATSPAATLPPPTMPPPTEDASSSLIGAPPSAMGAEPAAPAPRADGSSDPSDAQSFGAQPLGMQRGAQAEPGTVSGLRAPALGAEDQAPMMEGPPTSREAAIRQALAALRAQIRPAPDQVIAGLDGREAVIRILELPAIAAKKKRIGEVLPAEIDDLLPFEIEDLVIDHQAIDSPKGRPMIRVMAAAVPRERIAERLSELRDAGVDPRELAVGAAALDGLVPLMPDLQATPEGPVLVLEMEHQNTELCVIEEGVCTYARSITGGLDEVRAGRREPVEMALRRSLGGYRASGNPALAKVYLCGEGVRDADAIREWLDPLLQVPLVDLPLPEAPGTDPLLSARFGRAVALASRAAGKTKRLDLRQGEFASTQAMGQLREHGRLIAICAAMLIGAFGFATFARWSVLSSERESLQDQLAEVTENLFDESTRSAQQARELLEGGRRVEDPLPHFTAFDALDKISGAIPQEITHDTRRLRIEIDDETREGRMEIQGTVASIAERDTIVANIEAEECFGDVERGPTSPGPRNEGLNYRLEVPIHCPGDEPLVAERRSRSRRRNR